MAVRTMEKRQLSDFSLVEIVLLPFNLAATIFDLIFSIPYPGRILKWLWNTILTLGHFVIGLFDFVLWQLSFRPQKKFRIGFLILKDEHGQPLTAPEKVLPAVEKTRQIFAEARINILPVFPIPKRLSESGETNGALRWARVVQAGSAKRLLNVGCNRAAVQQDLGLSGSTYQYHTLMTFFDSGLRRISGYGAPVTVFVVKDLDGFGGCSLGWLSDYVTVKSTSLGATAHELGHACNLFHRKDEHNLMHPASPRQPSVHLTTWQIAMLRASRHVTYF